MAYGVRKIPVVDLQKSKGIGIKIPFDSNSVFTTVYTSKEQLKYNLINYILTDKRERPMNPTFGLGLRSKIFEQMTLDESEVLQTMIKSELESNFPNVKLIDLSVISDPDHNSIDIKLSYTIISTSETDTANIVIQNG